MNIRAYACMIILEKSIIIIFSLKSSFDVLLPANLIEIKCCRSDKWETEVHCFEKRFNESD